MAARYRASQGSYAAAAAEYGEVFTQRPPGTAEMARLIWDVRRLTSNQVSAFATWQEETSQNGRDETPFLPLPRYGLESARPDTSGTVTVPYADGSQEDVDASLASRLAIELERANVAGIFAPRVIAATRRTVGDLLATRPFDRPGADVVVMERLANGAQAIAEAETAAPPTSRPSARPARAAAPTGGRSHPPATAGPRTTRPHSDRSAGPAAHGQPRHR
jgi:hypothetical protein